MSDVNIEAEFTLNEQPDIQADFSIKLTPEKVSQLENDLNFQTETQVQEQIQAESDVINGRIDDEVSTLNSAIESEATTRAETDTSLQNGINTLNDDLTLEISNRTSADEVLQGNIDTVSSNLTTEISDRQDADATLQGNINTVANDLSIEETARINANTTLQGNIDTLSGTVTSNYNILDGKITDEATARGNADTTLQNNIDTLSGTVTSNYNTLDGKISANKTSIDNHKADKNNPHEVTKSQVGLGNVDNTSDADKPVSTAQQTALDGKVDKLSTKPTAGTYTKVDINAEGQVTSGTTLQASDIPSLHLTKVTDVTSTSTEVNQLHESGAVKSDFEKLHAITASASELNILDGATVTTNELNVLDGITASTTELNYTDGVTSNIQTQINSKQANITSTNMLSSDLVDDSNKTHKFATSAQLTQIATNQSDISTINGKIPSQATSSNQLADKEFVNSSISTNTANFIGTFNSVADLNAYSGTVTNNDYAFVVTTDSLGNSAYDRYKYTTATTPASWVFEYELNNSSFTSDQWAAINSLITAATKVTHTANTAVGGTTTPVYVNANGEVTPLSYTLAKSVPSDAKFTDTTYTITTGSANGTIAVNDSDVAVKGLGSAAYTPSSDYATSAQGSKADSAVQSVTTGSTNGTIDVDGSDVAVYGLGSAAYTPSTDYATASQGSKADTAIQSVTTGSANGTISVDGTDVAVYGLGSAAYTASTAYATSAQGGKADSAIQTVKVNGSALTPDSNKAVDISVPTNTNQLTNGAGFITGINSSMVTTALGYTPYNSANPNGYQANVIETIKVNSTAQTVTSKAVDISVPTKVSQLTNDSGYTTNTGTVTSVNNVSPVNGNVTLSIPAAVTVDSALSSTSTNPVQNKVINSALSGKYDASNPNGYTSNAGTITGITMNGASKGTSGVVDLGTVITDVSGKQDTLVSGTNIKTINGNSLLGSGNITIQGGTDVEAYTANEVQILWSSI